MPAMTRALLRMLWILAGCLLLAGAGWASSADAGSVPGSADQVRPLLIGASAPEVTLKTIDGETVALHEAVASKPTVVIFYRGGW